MTLALKKQYKAIVIIVILDEVTNYLIGMHFSFGLALGCKINYKWKFQGGK